MPRLLRESNFDSLGWGKEKRTSLAKVLNWISIRANQIYSGPFKIIQNQSEKSFESCSTQFFFNSKDIKLNSIFIRSSLEILSVGFKVQWRECWNDYTPVIQYILKKIPFNISACEKALACFLHFAFVHDLRLFIENSLDFTRSYNHPHSRELLRTKRFIIYVAQLFILMFNTNLTFLIKSMYSIIW